MRITCPECNAHYEIGEDLIRPVGRDVQCSNCGTTWFQDGRGPAAGGGDPTAGPAAEAGDDREKAADANAHTGDRTSEVAAPSTARPARRPTADKAALDILREERAREDRVRAGKDADPPAMEMPAGEGGAGRTAAPSTDPRDTAAAERVRMGTAATRARERDGGRSPPRDAGALPAETTGAAGENDPVTESDASDDLSGDTPSPASGAASDSSSGAVPARRGRLTRRGLLPDIEEINSSLRPDSGTAAERTAENSGDPGTDNASRPGFRLGFLAICAIAVFFAGLYAFADALVRVAPALTEPATRYVAWIDARRTGLEDAVEALTERIAPEP